MTFDQILSGTKVFLDANTLIYHFASLVSLRLSQMDADAGFTHTDIAWKHEMRRLHIGHKLAPGS